MTSAFDPVLCTKLITDAREISGNVQGYALAAQGILRTIATQLEAAMVEIDRRADDNLRLDKLSRCITIGCGLAGRRDLAGLTEYPCPLAPRLRITQLETEVAALKRSIADLFDDVLGAHPQTYASPAEQLSLISAHDLEQAQRIAHLEARIAFLASMLGAEPVQSIDEDLVMIECELTKHQSSDALLAMDVESRGCIKSLETRIKSLETRIKSLETLIEEQRMRIVELATGSPQKPGLQLPEGAVEWLLHGQRGLSSEAIFSHLTGALLKRSGPMYTPVDAYDLRRCRLLLDQVPALRSELSRMAEVSDHWRGLIERWDEVCALMDEEIPDWRGGNWVAPLTAEMLFQIARPKNKESQ